MAPHVERNGYWNNYTAEYGLCFKPYRIVSNTVLDQVPAQAIHRAKILPTKMRQLVNKLTSYDIDTRKVPLPTEVDHVVDLLQYWQWWTTGTCELYMRVLFELIQQLLIKYKIQWDGIGIKNISSKAVVSKRTNTHLLVMAFVDDIDELDYDTVNGYGHRIVALTLEDGSKRYIDLASAQFGLYNVHTDLHAMPYCITDEHTFGQFYELEQPDEEETDMFDAMYSENYMADPSLKSPNDLLDAVNYLTRLILVNQNVHISCVPPPGPLIFSDLDYQERLQFYQRQPCQYLTLNDSMCVKRTSYRFVSNNQELIVLTN